MNVRKIVQWSLGHRGEGVDIDADLNAAVAANVGEKANAHEGFSHSRVSTRSRQRVVKRTDRRR